MWRAGRRKKQEGGRRKVRGWEEEGGRSAEQRGQLLYRGGASHIHKMGFSGYQLTRFSGFRRGEKLLLLCFHLPKDSNTVKVSSCSSPAGLKWTAGGRTGDWFLISIFPTAKSYGKGRIFG